ncbi:gliding motility lipoprotein GldD [Sphingobacterium tabacisoli]|uniref:Gliding motility lipoprotein GldD n=1 Tax=Sphingobacterium tabacisoli TaxID=2044855 RepID=A0ABW5L1H1_9SPHI|nr:gliding motility lipoprotein GldD [Sphingobacterium tabacisoli]
MIRNITLLILAGLTITGCNNDDYSPKPRGFHRIIFPEKIYIQRETGCPYSFEIPKYSNLAVDKSSNAKPCWKNLDFPQFNARLHLSYFEIGPNSTLEQLTEDARTFAFKHTAMASAIEQQVISLPEHNVYGLEYHIQGNTASNYQFFISDKSKHYLRGALYFNEKPHLDSIQPVLKFIEEDIAHLINTSKWF